MPHVPPSSRPSVSPDPGRDVSTARRRLQLFWLCLGLGLLAVIVLIWVLGFTWWKVLIAALVILCPAIAAWLLLGGLDSWPKPPRTSR